MSLGHGLTWIAVLYLIWGLVERHRCAHAFDNTAPGDLLQTVITRFGWPDLLMSQAACHFRVATCLIGARRLDTNM